MDQSPDHSRHANVDDSLIEELRGIVGERLSLGQSVRQQHGEDLSFHEGAAPDVVVFARSTQEVSDIVKVCAARRVPIIPYGAGTSLEGHLAALQGGVSLDLSAMDQIIATRHDDMDATVQAGVTRKQLNQNLHNTGLFFPIDPGADATLGGMVATGASGTNAVRYGTMRENVMALTVVRADGRIIQTGNRARKSSAGYDLTRLFIGSEGTLGIVTEVTVRLYGIPEFTLAAVVSFADIERAVNTVIQTMQMDIPIARIEFVDDVQMAAINTYSKLDYAEQPTLFLEFGGSEVTVREQVKLVEDLCLDNGGGDFRWAEKQEDRNTLWQARHDAAYAAMALRPGSKPWFTDVCVPISRLADCILATRRDIDNSPLTAPILGHVGDGNFHLALLIDPQDKTEFAAAESINSAMIHRAIDMGGTCSGEHGIGYGKKEFMSAEHGEALDTMRDIKRALDPDNIMNPGKIFDL
ncbi:MAG TPA: FAD-binding protein [Rhodospirillales bacterium]|nr:FAD-binding protein [Rhodospirillales bacterium]